VPVEDGLNPPVSRGPAAASPVYLIDASVFIFRAYYSVPVTLTDLDGQPVNALHGFARFIGDLIESVGPTHMAVAFDESLATSFRNRIYPPYKAHREPAPLELKQQFRLCREFCRAFGLAEFSSPEFEADDVIGTLAKRARAGGRASVIVTRDKDLAQLVGPDDEFWDYVADVRYAYDDIEERFGANPEAIADFLALTGDAVDNIRGVPGIGRKTASILLKHFASLDALYANLDRVAKLKVRNAGFVTGQLRDYREAAFLARQLTGIYCDMPIQAEVSDLRRRPPDLALLERFYDGLGFGRLLRNQAERIAART
jgi:5'-3' exonuclease